jgi:hypothetical protein
MAADNTLTFTNISLTSENMDETDFTLVEWGGIKFGFGGLSQEDWNPGPGGGGGGSSRPSTGFLYPRGQG